MLKKFLTGLSIGVLVTIGIATPAQAAPGCPTNAICFHDTSSSYPNHWRDGADTSTGECHAMPGSANNTTSYITNRNSRTWYVYTGIGCSTWAGTIYANSSGAMTGSWNNSITSYKRG